MTDRHSFNSYIRNSWIFVALVDNAHSFNSYIRNTHTFELIVDAYEVIPSWFLGVHNRFTMGISAVLLGMNFTLAIPVRSIAIGFTASLLQMTQHWILDVTVKNPVVTAVMRMTQGMGNADIVLPFSTQMILSQSFPLGTTGITIPPVVIVPTITAAQYRMLNYYDADLLSALDANLLSAMDAVAA